VQRRGRDIFVPPAKADSVYGYAVFGRVVEGMDVVERIRHVPVRTVGRGEDTFENVPVDPVVIRKAAPLSPNH
jgi:peptidyl-prolyl cis-trans isomerase A (cyclophilin A)